MRKLVEFIQTTTGLSPEVQTKLLISAIIIFILWLLRILVIRIIWRRTEEIRTRYVWQKTVTSITVTLIIILVGRVWFKVLQSMATFLGLISAGVAIALKDLVTNIAGWFFILIRRPFIIGDRIQIGDNAGDVIDIRLFQFTILEIGNWVDADQSTGRIIHIPNGKLFSESLANYSKAFQYIWNEIPVLITFESNWEKAKNILQKIASTHAEHLSKSAEKRIKEASKRFMIFYSQLTPIVYTCVKDSGVLLTMRYLCEPRHRRNSEHAIWEDILGEFTKCKDIDFAYPTQRFYTHQLKKKTKTESPSGNKDIKTSEK